MTEPCLNTQQGHYIDLPCDARTLLFLYMIVLNINGQDVRRLSFTLRTVSFRFDLNNIFIGRRLLRRHNMLWIYFSNAYYKLFCIVHSDICEPQLLQKLEMISFRMSFTDRGGIQLHCTGERRQETRLERDHHSTSSVTVANVGLAKNGLGWDLAKG